MEQAQGLDIADMTIYLLVVSIICAQRISPIVSPVSEAITLSGRLHEGASAFIKL
jgi:hypothetical protein